MGKRVDQIVVFVAINIALLTKDKHVSYSAMSNEFQMGGEVGEKSNINVSHCWLLFAFCISDLERLRYAGSDERNQGNTVA